MDQVERAWWAVLVRATEQETHAAMRHPRDMDEWHRSNRVAQRARRELVALGVAGMATMDVAEQTFRSLYQAEKDADAAYEATLVAQPVRSERA